jgi:hypothetical protein
MKKLSILFILLLFICRTTPAQDSITDIPVKPQNLKRHINELAYQFPFMIEYGYYHNFNNIIEPGFAIKLGIGGMIDDDYGIPAFEFITGEINLRNAFSRRKDNHLLDYDIGVACAYMPEFYHQIFFGLNLQSNIRIYRFIKLGLDMKLGNLEIERDRDLLMLFWYPYLLLSF